MARKSTNSKLSLPKLYPFQQEIIDHPARFKVVSIGRRAGKTFAAKIAALDVAVNWGGDVWLVFPTYGTAQEHWREIVNSLRGAPFITYQSLANRRLEFASGGAISIKSGDKPDNLRGAGLDFVVVDEAAFIERRIFNEVLLPAVSDRQGTILLISTPYGKNWFYDMWLRGQDERYPQFMSWQFPTTVNPDFPKEEFELMRTTMPIADFRREFLAEFHGTGGGVFNNFEGQALLDPLKEPVSGHSYTMGIDWGRKNDFTVISVFDRDSGDQVWLDRFNDIGWEIQSRRVQRAIKFWNPSYCYVETNSIGDVMFEQLKSFVTSDNPTTKMRPVYMTNIVKRSLVDEFAGLLENKRIRLITGEHPLGAEQLSEFSTYELSRTQSGNMITYRAKKGYHDDFVTAGMVACKGLRIKRKSGSASKSAENIFFGGGYNARSNGVSRSQRRGPGRVHETRGQRSTQKRRGLRRG